MNETPTPPLDQGPEQPCTNHFSDGSKIFPNRDCCNGPEHNPDGLTPEQYGAPVFRLLGPDEVIQEGDEYYSRICESWEVTSNEGGNWTPSRTAESLAYRRRVARKPTAEQRIAELERKLADIEGPEPYSEEILERRDLVMRINVRDRRIAELERDIAALWEQLGDRDKLVAQVSAERAQLARERDEVIRNATLWADQSTLNATRWQDAEARLKEANEGWLKTAADATAEWDQRLNALSSLLIFHGHRIEEARSEGFPLAAEGNCKCRICSAYYAENAALRAQLAASEKDRQWQPIETAPKDGTKFLIWEVDFKAYRIAWWREHRGAFGDDGYRYNFAHWLPLRAAPTQSEAL